MAFTVKDWTAYTDNNTTEKDVVLLMALPDGVGGFDLINMTKEEFFNIASDMVIQFNQSSGEMINFSQADSTSMNYIAGAKILSIIGTSNLIFAETFGGNADIQIVNGASRSSMVLGGVGKDGFITLLNTLGDETDIEATATVGLTTRLTDARNDDDPTTVELQYREDRVFDRATAASGASTDLPGSYETVFQASASGGGIANHTFNMPAVLGGSGSARNKVRLVIEGTITTVTMATPGAETIDEPFTSAGSSFQVREWIYDPGGVWRRIL